MQKLDYEFFCHPKIVSGNCALENIPTELAGNDAYKPLVIAGRDLIGRGMGKTLIRAFYDSGYTLGGIYDEVRDYASISLAREAAILFSERGCDSIIALGGGPVADVARAANILVSENTENLFQFFDGTPIKKRLKPFVLIPACGLNGMEAGKTVTVDHRQLASEFLFPDVIILDKRITPGCSRKCVAESAAMAVDNALTALTDQVYNPMSNAFVHASLRFISGSLKESLANPGNKKHGLAMANAGVLAGIAAANARPGMVRVLSWELEKSTGFSRGVFTSLLTPAAIETLREKSAPAGDELLLAVAGMDVYSETLADQRAGKGFELAAGLMEEIRKAILEETVPPKIPSHIISDACEREGSKGEGGFTAPDCRALLEPALNQR